MDSPFHLPDTNDTGEMKRIFGALSNFFTEVATFCFYFKQGSFLSILLKGTEKRNSYNNYLRII